jgi:hypothetical protein
MIGIRSALLTATKGTVVLDTQFDSYKPCVGIVAQREKGSLLAHEQGNRAAAVHMCVVLLRALAACVQRWCSWSDGDVVLCMVCPEGTVRAGVSLL